MSKPRSEVLLFRVSLEEYEAICEAVRHSGKRGMSEFLRDAALEKAKFLKGENEQLRYQLELRTSV